MMAVTISGSGSQGRLAGGRCRQPEALFSTRSGLQHTDDQTKEGEFPKLLEAKLHLIKGNLSKVSGKLHKN